MRPRPSTLLAATSLTLLTIVLLLWLRSYAPETLLLESHRGRLFLIAIDCPPKVAHDARDTTTHDGFLYTLTTPRPNTIVGSTGLPPPPPTEHHALGFLLVRGDWCEIHAAGDHVWTPSFWFLGLPYWSLALLTAPLPARWLYFRSRSNHRRHTNRCPTCGYDLRATPTLCPECGTTPNPRLKSEI